MAKFSDPNIIKVCLKMSNPGVYKLPYWEVSYGRISGFEEGKGISLMWERK